MDESPAARVRRIAALDADSSARAPLERAGSLAAFSMQAVKDLGVAVRLYPAEVMAQAGRFIRSNTLVVLAMMFILGALYAITGSFLFEGLGLDSYMAANYAVPMMRGVAEIVFGWILAAKAGCGIVAELGAMRTSEEIDAMEVMGIRSGPYLVGTRLAASLLVLPPLFITGLGVHFLAGKLFTVDFLGTVSSGGFTYVLFLLQGPRDLFIALIWGTLVGFLVTVVACYYGYNAGGGPVGVGRNTAQAMLVNLVMISVTAMILAQLFYGGNLAEAFGT